MKFEREGSWLIHRRDLLRALMTTPLAGWLGSWIGPAPDSARIYARAFDWSTRSSPKDRELLNGRLAIAIDDPRVDGLIERARPAIQAIREALSIDRCGWTDQVTTSANLTQGHLDVTNGKIVRVACLSARRHARSGRGREALDDIFAALMLSHRVGTSGVMIARLIEGGGKITGFQTLGRLLPDLDRRTLDDLWGRLDRLPSPGPASVTVNLEWPFLVSSLRERLGSHGSVIEPAGWAEMLFDDEEATTLHKLTGGDRSKFLLHLEATAPAFEELARRIDLPRPSCRTALNEFAEAERFTRPIAAGMVEKVWGIRHVVDRMQALRSMLQAGVTLVRDGEAAFLQRLDPYGTGPFAMERLGRGYRIRSAMADEGKPEVSLDIGETA